MKLAKNTFETSRVYLRPFRETDLDDLYAYASVEGVGEMAGWKHHESIEESQIILDMLIKGENTYAIEFKSEKKVIGSIGLSTKDDIIEIGYVLSKDYWNRGIISECIQVILSYCFDKVGLEKIYCAYYKDNDISKRINKKLGFRFVKKEIVNTLGLGKKERVLTVMRNPALVYDEEKKMKDDIVRLLDEVEKEGLAKEHENNLFEQAAISEKSEEEIAEKISQLKAVDNIKKIEIDPQLAKKIKVKRSKIKLQRINKSNKGLIHNLYMSAFPKEERIDFSYLYLKANTRRADFLAVYNDDEFIGLVYLVYYKKIVFLFFFAIEEKHRSKGYGSQILEKLKEIFKARTIVLWVETTKENYEEEFINLPERKIRKKFYFRNGFVQSSYSISEKGVRYDVLEYGTDSVSEMEMHELLKRFFGKPIHYLYYVHM